MLFKLLVYDFDGVMTDNKVYVDQYGNEMVQVNSPHSNDQDYNEINKQGSICEDGHIH